uniref:C2H2-type domain-containing protein n=1 Tax=Wuchereria bancrofti TaxID=6293 RepID=A0A1I8EW51_WUCBA
MYTSICLHTDALVWFVAYLSVRHFILAIRLASSVFVCRCIHEGENVKGEWKCLSANLASSRRPLTDVEWRCSLQRRRMLDAERKRRLREDNAYRVLERARNREARRRQRENPKFREAERARARAYYMSLSSTATNEGIICDSCGLIVKHVKALRTHRAEFHPRQRMSLENICNSSSRDIPPSSDGSTVDFSKLIMNAIKKGDSVEHSLVDFYGIIFSDVEAAVERMLSCKLKKHQSFDLQTHLALEAKFEELREYVLETEKNVEKLAVYGAASSNSMEEQKLSIPSDLISMLSTLFTLLLYHRFKDFILHRIPPESSGLTGIVEKSNETGKIGGN